MKKVIRKPASVASSYSQRTVKFSKVLGSTDSNLSGFDIDEDGVLVEYTGHGVDVVIPNNVTRIENFAFTTCTSLTSVTIPDSVTEIGVCAFYRCTNLKTIKIPNSVTSIARDAFGVCTSLKTIKIPNSVTSIASGVFAQCASLTSVEIPDSVTEIGDYAFYNCKNLKTLKIPNSVTSIAKDAFEGCNKLPKDVKNYISQLQDDDDGEYYNDEMSFAEWYDSSQGEDDGMEFAYKLESLVKSNYNVDEFFEEPSVQGYQGGDFIWITLSDGSKYEFVFDWYDEQSAIYEDGPKEAAMSYFQKIQSGIDSGSALVD